MRLFDRKHEAMPRELLSQFQLERMQALLARLKRNVRRYRELLGELRIDSLSDLGRLPMTEPEDLVAAFPYGMFALPLAEVIRLYSAVGPRGKPVVIGHTRNDLIQWGRLAARQLTAAGATSHDVIQICQEGSMLRGYAMGAEQIEAAVIPEDPFHIEYQLAMLQNYRVTVLVTTPSNARELAELLAAKRLDPQSLSLRVVLLSRPVSASERDDLHAGLFAKVRCNFGVAEILDPGLCVECAQGRFHVNEDHFLVECVDGELIVTTLCREAMPLLRYRARVGCSLRQERCACGRTGVVLEPGERRDGRLRVSEMPLYREQIAEVLGGTRAAGEPFEVEITDRKVVIMLRVTPRLFGDTIRVLGDLKREIEGEFMTRLGVEAEVQYLAGARD